MNICFYIRWLFHRLLFALKRKIFKASEENRFGNGLVLSQVTYYATGNAGDTCLSHCLRKTFNKLSNIKRWNLINIRDKVSPMCIQKINQTSALCIGGGGLFLPDTNPNEISGWQWAISKEQIDEIQVPIIIYSVGYNYFRGQEPNSLFIDNINYLSQKASFIGLRNCGSVQFLKSILDNESKNKIVYQPCTTTLIRKLYGNNLKSKKKTNKIAFNIAFDRESARYGSNKEEILQQLASTAKLIEQRGYLIVYILHCRSDYKFVQYLKRKKVNFKLIDASLWLPMQIINLYNQIDLVIGMRGHSQMIPFGLNCEIISLGSHEKMKWFLQDIDALDWYEELNYEPWNLSQRLLLKFIDIHETNQSVTKKRLIEQQEKLWEITLNNWNSIKKIMR